MPFVCDLLFTKITSLYIHIHRVTVTHTVTDRFTLLFLVVL